MTSKAEGLLRSLIENSEPLKYVRGFLIPEAWMNEVTKLFYSGRKESQSKLPDFYDYCDPRRQDPLAPDAKETA